MNILVSEFRSAFDVDQENTGHRLQRKCKSLKYDVLRDVRCAWL